MSSQIEEPASEIDEIRLAASGDRDLLGELLLRHEPRLLRMVELRLDPRLQSRIDPADVVQEAFLQASRRLKYYLRKPAVPFFVWLRFITAQALAAVHRRHLGVKARAAGREISIYRAAMPQASSAMLADRLVGKLTSPSRAAIKAELKVVVQEALNHMQDIDREVIALRHFEQLTNAETARVLEITEAAAWARYARALTRLKGVLKRPARGWEAAP